MISCKFRGRLGNQLFQYAVCRTIAEKNNVDFGFHNPKGWLGSNLFKCNLGIKDTNKKEYIETKDRKFEQNKKILNYKNIRLVGFFQSERYFDFNEENVKEWYKTKNIKMRDDECIIHLRGGDFKSKNNNYTLPKEYFFRAKKLILNENDKIKFSIITDDPILAKKYFPDDNIISSTLEEDFLKLKFANYLIISNSTFSWWGGWLNTNCKKIIGPKYWLNVNKSKSWYPYDIKSKKFIHIL